MAKTTDKKTNTEHVESKCADLSQAELNELFANGKAHYDKGEYDEAEKFWQEAAEAGDANAKVALTWIDAKKPKEFVIDDGVLIKYNGDGGDVKIPDGVTSIGYCAFSNCNGLTSIKIPNSVLNINHYAFFCCRNLTTVEIPSSVTRIEFFAFDSCDSLLSIKVSSENKNYHSVCNCLIETATKTLIAGCKNSVIPPDGSVTSVGSGAFSRCYGLTSVEIPNSVTSIGSSAFYACSRLTSIKIPDSVESIGDYAFCGSGLTSIEIPNSVTSIGSCAFSGCSSLRIGFGGTKKEWKAIKKEKGWNENTGKYRVWCTDGSVKK